MEKKKFVENVFDWMSFIHFNWNNRDNRKTNSNNKEDNGHLYFIKTWQIISKFNILFHKLIPLFFFNLSKEMEWKQNNTTSVNVWMFRNLTLSKADRVTAISDVK